MSTQSKETKYFRKTYRFREELEPYLFAVLSRGYYEFMVLSPENDPEMYQAHPCKPGYALINTNAPSGAFHKMLQRAMCEQQDAEVGGFHITFKELWNPTTYRDLSERNPKGIFILMGKE